MHIQFFLELSNSMLNLKMTALGWFLCAFDMTLCCQPLLLPNTWELLTCFPSVQFRPFQNIM